MSDGRPLRVAVVNQLDEGGATAAAREVLHWGPERGLDVRYWPEEAADRDGLARDLDAFAPDVVHLHCFYREYGHGLLPELSRRHRVVFTVHDVAVVNQYGTECWECYRNAWCLGCPGLELRRRWRPNYRVLERFRKRRLHRGLACELVYPSAWMKRRLARTELGRLPGQVIPYGVDTAFFAPGQVAREALGLPDGPLVLFAGNMYSADDHRKGLPDLLAAFPEVRKALPDARLVVAGRLVGVADQPWLHVLGEVPRETLPDLYRVADAFCIPSRGDNLPVAVLEALASGLPVVGTCVGGIPEEIVDGETGVLVPPRDPAALAAGLVRTLQRPEPDRWRVAARERAQIAFSRSHSADLHEALYRAPSDTRRA